MKLLRPRRMLGALAACALIALGAAAPASATHFRYANLGLTQTSATTMDGSATVAYRCTFFFGGCPAPGTTFGADAWFFPATGSSTGGNYKVVSTVPPEDYMVARGWQGSPADETINLLHNGAAVTGTLSGCCSISTQNNHPDTPFSNFSFFNPNNEDESAIVQVPPIVDVGNNGVQSFTVNATDPGGETLRWRLATNNEACSGSCPADTNPPGLTINPNTGLVQWDTTSVALGLWSTNVVVESLVANVVEASTMVNFLVRVNDQATNQPPQFNPPTPPDGAEFTVAPGDTLIINTNASDPDAGDTVTLGHLGLPPGSTYNTTPGNPATGQFSWTPTAAQAGDYLVTFTAFDQNGASAPSRTIKIKVIQTVTAGRMVGNATVAGTKYASIVDCDVNVANSKARPFTVGNTPNQFKATSFTTVSCYDDPNLTPSPTPQNPNFDTQKGVAKGTFGGAPGYTLQWTLTDAGVNNPADSARLKITKDSDGSTVLDIPLQAVSSGQNYALN